jgi:hypothetical protein
MSSCKCSINISHSSYTEAMNVCFNEQDSGECTELCDTLVSTINSKGIPTNSLTSLYSDCDYTIDKNKILDFTEKTLDRIIYSDTCTCKDSSRKYVGDFLIDLQFTDQCNVGSCNELYTTPTFQETLYANVSASRLSSDSGEYGTEAPIFETSTEAPITNSPVTSTEAPIYITNSPIFETSTEAPIYITNSPVTSTEAPIYITNSPVTSTEAPIYITNSPVTGAPIVTVSTTETGSPVYVPNSEDKQLLEAVKNIMYSACSSTETSDPPVAYQRVSGKGAGGTFQSLPQNKRNIQRAVVDPPTIEDKAKELICGKAYKEVCPEQYDALVGSLATGWIVAVICLIAIIILLVYLNNKNIKEGINTQFMSHTTP